MNPMSIQIARSGRLVASSIALSLGLLVAGCGGMATNRSMNSVHQPVVEKVNYTLDLATNGNGAGDSGLAQGEQSRLAGWFDAMGLKYGDRVFIDDPSGNPAVRSAVEAVAGRYGLTLAEGTPLPRDMSPPAAHASWWPVPGRRCPAALTGLPRATSIRTTASPAITAAPPIPISPR